VCWRLHSWMGVENVTLAWLSLGWSDSTGGHSIELAMVNTFLHILKAG
jgi:hypothetical protein